jgi:hypothetical protein
MRRPRSESATALIHRHRFAEVEISGAVGFEVNLTGSIREMSETELERRTVPR